MSHGDESRNVNVDITIHNIIRDDNNCSIGKDINYLFDDRIMYVI